MSGGEPDFIFAPYEVLKDSRLTLRQLRVLLAVLSWRKKNTNTARVSREVLSERTGYPETRISEITHQLVELGWLFKVGRGGRSRWVRYEIRDVGELLQALNNGPGPGVGGDCEGNDYQNGNGNQISNPKETETVTDSVTKTVTDSVTKTVTDSVTGIDTVTNTEKHTVGGAGAWLIDIWPQRVGVEDLRRRWPDLDALVRARIGQGLDELRPVIEADVRARTLKDRHWLAGYVPKPAKYVEDLLWLEDLVPLAVAPAVADDDRYRLPGNDHELTAWAKRHGYPAAWSGESYAAWRGRLGSAVEQRRLQDGRA